MLTQEENQQRNAQRCKQYYALHKHEATRRRVIYQIRKKGYFPRNTNIVSTQELVESFMWYQKSHTPSDFALKKFRSILNKKWRFCIKSNHHSKIIHGNNIWANPKNESESRQGSKTI